MTVGKLRLFQYEVARQCQFAIMAAGEMNRAFEAIAASQNNTPTPPLNVTFREDGVVHELSTPHGSATADALRLPPEIALFWYSLHMFLTATSNISKLLWGVKGGRRTECAALRESLAIDESSPLKPRTMRDHFEHFDERLSKHVPPGSLLVDWNIGPAIISDDRFEKVVYLRNFDHERNEATFLDEVLQLQPLIDTVVTLERAALEVMAQTFDRLVKD